jgi:hypothetical protein
MNGFEEKIITYFSFLNYGYYKISFLNELNMIETLHDPISCYFLKKFKYILKYLKRKKKRRKKYRPLPPQNSSQKQIFVSELN